MNTITVIILILIALFIIAIPIFGIRCEKKDFNNGFCPKCGNKLYHFDTDSQGGRGYCCHKCPYFTWISWNCVDKKYKL